MLVGRLVTYLILARIPVMLVGSFVIDFGFGQDSVVIYLRWFCDVIDAGWAFCDLFDFGWGVVDAVWDVADLFDFVWDVVDAGWAFGDSSDSGWDVADAGWDFDVVF